MTMGVFASMPVMNQLTIKYTNLQISYFLGRPKSSACPWLYRQNVVANIKGIFAMFSQVPAPPRLRKPYSDFLQTTTLFW